MNQRKRNPLDMAAPHLFYILQRQGTGGQIARIGIVFSTFYQEVVEVLVRDDSFTAYDNVPFLADTLRNAADDLRQVGDIGADMSVAACDNLSQLSVVICHHKRQTVQLPGNPYRTPFRPFHQIGHLFGFRQGECRELMLLLLTFHVVFRYLLRGGVGKYFACFLLQPFEFVEACVPLVVTHQFGLTVIICI